MGVSVGVAVGAGVSVGLGVDVMVAVKVGTAVKVSVGRGLMDVEAVVGEEAAGVCPEALDPHAAMIKVKMMRRM